MFSPFATFRRMSTGRRGSRSGARSSRSSSTASEPDVSKSDSKKQQKGVGNKSAASKGGERRSSKDTRGYHGRKNSKDKDSTKDKDSIAPKAAPKKSATAKTKAGSTFQVP